MGPKKKSYTSACVYFTRVARKIGRLSRFYCATVVSAEKRYVFRVKFSDYVIISAVEKSLETAILTLDVDAVI